MNFICSSQGCQNISVIQCSCKNPPTLICKVHINDHVRRFGTLTHRTKKLDYHKNEEAKSRIIQELTKFSETCKLLKITLDQKITGIMESSIDVLYRRLIELNNFIEKTKEALNQELTLNEKSGIEAIEKLTEEIAILEADIYGIENVQIAESTNSYLLEEEKALKVSFPEILNFLNSLDENTLPDQLECSFYNNINLCNDEELLNNFKTLTQNHQNLLCNIIFQTRNNENLALAASNSVSILVKANYSFNNKDFKNVKIPYANLSGGIFYKTDFSDSDLDHCNISRAQFLNITSNNVNLPTLKINQQWVDEIKDLSISHSGKYIAVSQTLRINIWDIHSKEIVGILTDETIYLCLQTTSWSYDDKFVISGDYRGYIFIWEPSSRNLVKKLHVCNARISNISWAPNDYRIAWCNDEKYVVVTYYDEESNIFQQNLQFCPTLVAWSPSGRYLAYSGNGSVNIWDSTYLIRPELHIKEWPINDIYALEWIYWDNYLAFAGKDAYIYIWDFLSTERPIAFHNGEAYEINAIKWNQKWKLLAVGNFGGSVTVWSLWQNNSVLIENHPELLCCGHSKTVSSLSWSDQLLVSGSFDGTLKIWKIDNDSNARKKIEESIIWSKLISLVEDLLWASPASQLLIANSIKQKKA